MPYNNEGDWVPPVWVMALILVLAIGSTMGYVIHEDLTSENTSDISNR